MDNAQKAIMVGVGLFITIIIISLVLLIVNYGNSMAKDSLSKLDTLSQQLRTSLTEDYDGKTMTGTLVLNAVREYQNSTSLCIVLLNRDGDVVGTTGAQDITEISGTVGGFDVTVDAEENMNVFDDDNPRTNINDFTNTTDVAYINKARNYNSSLIRSTTNDAIVGIAFQPVA